MRRDIESFDPTADSTPREIINEFRREALERTLEGKEYRVLGEFRPELADNAQLSFGSETGDRESLEEQFKEWLKEKGLFPRAFAMIHDRNPEQYDDSTGPWHRDGIDSEATPDKVVTLSEEQAGEELKLLWADKNLTQIRLHSDKTLVPTEPYQVVAVNNRLVDHRRPPETEAGRTLMTSNSVVLIK